MSKTLKTLRDLKDLKDLKDLNNISTSDGISWERGASAPALETLYLFEDFFAYGKHFFAS